MEAVKEEMLFNIIEDILRGNMFGEGYGGNKGHSVDRPCVGVKYTP